MKRLLSSLFLIVLALGSFGVIHAGRRVSVTASSPSAERNAATVRFAPRQINEANRRLRYTVKARYPQAVGAGDARLARLNEELRNLVTKEIADFKKDFQRPEGRTGSMGSYLETSYVVELASSDLVSVLFGVSSFYEGAAHPQHYTRVLNYDLKSGKQLALADLFKANSNYLALISDYAVRALTKELAPDADAEWIQTGAGTKEENYKSWNMSPKGLQVTFDPYQVASYAQGEHVVVIPYGTLRNVIDTDSPLARLAPVRR
jgi:hypothetical protein